MRVLFYNRGVEQLGVGYLMSYLEKKGHQVELLFDRGLDNNLYYRLDLLKFLNRWDQLIRGCPFQCTYCINNFYKNRLYKEFPGTVNYVRRRSPANVIDEIKFFRERYPISHVHFTDEMFVTDKQWTGEFLERYKREIADTTFSFSYYPGFIDEDVARIISRAGGNYAVSGTETANEEFRRNVLRRRISNEDILRTMRLLKKYNIKIGTTAIFGFPFETPEIRWETVKLLEKCDPDTVYSYIMYPFPGTEIADISLKHGFLSPENWEKIKQGFSSYHQDSLLEHPDISNAATMAKLLPLYIKVPRFFKPFLGWIMRKRVPRLAHFFYIVTVPFVYSEGCTREWIGDLLRVIFRSLPGRKNKR